MVERDANREFTLPLLLICEGYKDKKLLERLIEVRNLPKFAVETTGENKTDSGGITKFAGKLRSLKFRKNKTLITNIILIADADLSADDSFGLLCQQVKEAEWGEPPKKVLQPSNSKPAISIAIIPFGEPEGCMEHPCASAAKSAAGPLASSIDHLLLQVDRAWSANRKSKAWVRTSLAVRSENPEIPLHQVFSDKLDTQLIPLTDRAFDPIAAFLATFEILNTSAPSLSELPLTKSQQKRTKRLEPHTRPPRPPR